MNKIVATFLATAAMTQSLCGIDGDPMLVEKCTEYNYLANQKVISKEVVVSVHTAPELTTAIQNAAVNLDSSTTINVHGEIIGHFCVPATVHTIRLIGATSDATLNANGCGIPLTVKLGGKVEVEKLTITGADDCSDYGVVNFGSLKIVKSSVVNNGEGGGVLNHGNLFVHKSSISNNCGVGLYTQVGGITKITDSAIDNNSSKGLYTYAGSVDIAHSTVNRNGCIGLYNYYGAKLTVDDVKIIENRGYGISNDYASIVTVLESDITGNLGGGIYNEGTLCNIAKSLLSSNTGPGFDNYEYSVAYIDDCFFQYNTTGGIRNRDTSSLFIVESRFDGNVSTGQGGAIYNDGSSSVNINTSVFENNRAESGGAIYNANLLAVDDTKFENNFGTCRGGAISNSCEGSCVIKESKFVSNSTNGDGGGLENAGTATVQDSHFKENTAQRGGGLANVSSGVLLVTQSKVTNNTATNGVGAGGGIFSNGSSLTVLDSNVVNNISDDIVE